MADFAQIGSFSLARTRSGQVEVRLEGEGRAKNEAGGTILTLSEFEVADFLATYTEFMTPAG